MTALLKTPTLAATCTTPPLRNSALHRTGFPATVITRCARPAVACLASRLTTPATPLTRTCVLRCTRQGPRRDRAAVSELDPRRGRLAQGPVYQRRDTTAGR